MGIHEYIALTLVITFVGMAVCTRYAYKGRSLGMGVFFCLFALHAVSAFISYRAQLSYLAAFESEQISETTWTAPVVHIDMGVPITLAIVLAGCFLVGRRLVRCESPVEPPPN